MDREKLNEIIELVNRRIGPNGYECIEAEWFVEEAQILRLFIDKNGGKGIDLRDCVEVNRLLDESPEIDGMIPGQYSLEISSPGVERPLRLKSHFESNIGKEIQVRLGKKEADRVFGKGRLVEVSTDERITVETSRGPWTFPLSSLAKASLIFNWKQSSLKDDRSGTEVFNN